MHGFTPSVLSVFSGDQSKTAAPEKISGETHPVELSAFLVSRFGKDWVTWESDTIWQELKRVMGKAPDPPLKDKINAVKALLLSESFWLDHLVFEKVTMALNNHAVAFNVYQHPSPAMIANAIEEAGKIRSAEYSPEVQAYIAAVCRDDGLVVLQGPLGIAQDELDQLTAATPAAALKREVLEALGKVPGNETTADRYNENPVGVQLAKMAAIREYVKEF